MKIKKIEIEGFGKLNNFRILLNKDIQVIYGKNEAGKTTLMEFLKMIFYSRRKGSSTSAEDKLVRSRYSPWNGKPMQGSIEFTSKGFNYRVEKKIHPSSVLKDVTLFRNQSLGENINLGKKEEVGERVFGLDLYSFERSSYISNLGRAEFEEAKVSKDSILNKMFNLSANGESESSLLEVTSKIEEAIKDLEPLRGKNGKISIISSEIKDINNQIEEIEILNREQMDLFSQLTKIEKLIKEKRALENQIENIKALKKISELESLIKSIQIKSGAARKLRDLGITQYKDVISELILLKDKISLNEEKSKELNNFMKSVNEDSILISSEEINCLNLAIKERQNLESKIEKLKFFSNLKDFCSVEKGKLASLFYNPDELFSLLNQSTAENDDLENLKSLEESLRNKRFECESERNNLTSSLKLKLKKQSNNKIALIISFLALSTVILMIIKDLTPLSTVLLSIISIFGVAGALWTGFSFHRLKNEIKSLKKNIAAYNTQNHQQNLKELELKSLSCAQNLERINTTLLNLIKKETSLASERLDSLNTNINKMLEEKRSSNVGEYYENYAKSQNLAQSKEVYNRFLNKVDALKSEFIEIISKYSKVLNYSEATDFLDVIKSTCDTIEACDEEIHIKRDALNLKSISEFEIEDYLKKLKTQALKLQLDTNEEAIYSIEKRLEELKSLDISNSYIQIKSKIRYPKKSLNFLNEKLQEKKLKFSLAKEYLQSLKIAYEIIQETINEVRRKFNPRLNEEASKIFKELTGGEHSNICMNKDYSISLEKNNSYKSYESFSSGTIDQAYLTLKVAISKLLSSLSGEVPLILDDVLVRYDYSRVENTLRFLKENAKETQTIIFTCHEHVAKCAKKMGIEIIKLE